MNILEGQLILGHLLVKNQNEETLLITYSSEAEIQEISPYNIARDALTYKAK